MRELSSYFIFGEHDSGMVDLASFENNTVAGPISREQAETLISNREELLERIKELEK